MRHCWMVGLLGLLSLGWTPQEAQAQSTRPAKRASSQAQNPLMIYVPYRKLGPLLKKQGVYLTREQFSRVMKSLRQAQKALESRLPVSAVLTEAKYQGQITGEGFHLKGELSLRILRSKGYVSVKLPFAGMPLLSAKLDGKPALLYARARGYVLLARGAGLHKLVLRWGGRASRRLGWREAQLQIPPTPRTQLHFQLAAAGWQLRLNGKTWKPSPPKTKAAKIPTYAAALGPRQQLRFQWRPKTQRSVTQSKMMSAKVRLEAHLDEGVIRTRARVSVHVLQGKIQRLRVTLPPGEKLVAVQGGSQLQRWSLQTQGKKRQLALLLRKPLQGHYHLQLQFERLIKRSKGPKSIATLHVEGVQWQHGWVSLRAARTLELKVVRKQGITQMDPEEYAAQHQSSPPEQAFLYLKPGYQLQVEIRKIKARLRAEVFHRIHADEKQAVAHTRVVFQIERAGVFQLRFQLPQGWEKRDIRCPSMQNPYEEKKGLWVVPLSQKLGGPKVVHKIAPRRLWLLMRQILGWDFLRRLQASHRQTLRKRIERRRVVALFQRLFGASSTQPGAQITCHIKLRRSFDMKKGFSLPIVQPLDLENEKGMIGVAVPGYLELRTHQRKGLMPIDDLSEAAALRSGRYDLRQAFRYAVRPAAAAVSLKRKKTSIHAKIWLPVQLREDGIRIQGIVRYEVRYAGIKKLRLQVPTEYQKRLQILSSTREVHKKPGKKHLTYTFILNRKVPKDGTFSLRFVLSLPFKRALRVGELEQLALHAFSVPGALQQEIMWGLQKGESLSLQLTGMKGYERFDAAELPAWATPRKMARLIRSRRKAPSSIKVLLRKHRYARVLSTIISHLHLDAVLSREGQVQALALLRVKNRGRQFLKLRLPAKSTVSALRVGPRERYRFELDRKGELLVDLTQHTDGVPFAVAVQYRHSLGDGQQLKGSWGQVKLSAPTAVDTPIAQTSMNAYLPSGIHYAAFHTRSWHPHNSQGMWQLLRAALWGKEAFGFSPSNSNYYWLQRQTRPLWSKLPRRGRSFRFFTQSQAMVITAEYRSQAWQMLLELGIGLLALLLLLLLERRQWSWLSPMRLSLLALLGLGVVGALLPLALVKITHAATLAWACATTFWFGRGIYRSLSPTWQALAEDDDDDGDDDGNDGGDDTPPSPSGETLGYSGQSSPLNQGPKTIPPPQTEPPPTSFPPPKTPPPASQAASEDSDPQTLGYDGQSSPLLDAAKAPAKPPASEEQEDQTLGYDGQSSPLLDSPASGDKKEENE